MEIDKEIKEEMGETIRKMRKKRTRRDVLKGDVMIPFLWGPLTFSVKGEIWRVLVGFRGRTLWRSLGIGLMAW